MANIYSDPVQNITAAHLPGLIVETYALPKLENMEQG
jgi:hypothetical protein